MWFIAKFVIAAAIISSASWLAGKKPGLAGFIVALPITSMLALAFSFAQYRDMEKANEFAVSILVAVPLSLLFFVPFVLHKWVKLNFPAAYMLGIVCLAAGYALHSAVTRRTIF